MECLEEIAKICSRFGIDLGAEGGPVGRQLSYQSAPERMIVVHFRESDWLATVLQILQAIAEVEPDWFVFHRYGMPQARRFNAGSAGDLAEAMVRHFPTVQNELDDLYLLAESGRMFLTFDFLLGEEGIPREFSSIELTGRVLCSLNELGSEMQVFAKNG